MIDQAFVERLATAFKSVRADLLLTVEPSGHWVGELSSSALSTATAVSAISIYQSHATSVDAATSDRFGQLTIDGLHWLARHQNTDGGWGDTDRSRSNIATTMLVRAAFQLTGAPADPPDMLDRADAYIKNNGGIQGVRRRYGKDKTFAVPILTNCALAGLVPWREVSPLPFELAALPQSMYNLLRLPVVSYAIPALVAIGLARFRHAPPWNPLMRIIRGTAERKSLEVLEAMQPASGGFLEATPLTSFVVMSLASSGLADHAVTRHGLQFVVDSVREDGSWPIDTNLATWVTTLSVNALADGGEDLSELDCLDWLLECQQREVHPYTGAAPGGWAWTDLSGGVPDADDTPGALLAISAFGRQQAAAAGEPIPAAIGEAGETGIDWLLDLQNRDGGWPTFCRGWGKLPFDRSGTDLTAHAIRALHCWSINFAPDFDLRQSSRQRIERMLKATARGLLFLKKQQHEDGSWTPLWFGNEHYEGEANPIYGTAKVLLAYRDLNWQDAEEARRGFDWLLAAQDLGGGWGGSGHQLRRGHGHEPSSVEETALALEALLADPRLESDRSLQHMVAKGLAWLTDAVEHNRHREPSPIGFYFAKLWYHEQLYPLIYATSALGQAVRRFADVAGDESHPTTRPRDLVSTSPV